MVKPVVNTNFERYMNTYSGRELRKKYGDALNVQGVWQIKGEDPNCARSGAHYQPILATVQGKLIDVVRAGVDMPRFWQWGGGGDFIEVKIATIEDMNNRAEIERQIRVKEEELKQLKSKLGM